MGVAHPSTHAEVLDRLLSELLDEIEQAEDLPPSDRDDSLERNAHACPIIHGFLDMDAGRGPRGPEVLAAVRRAFASGIIGDWVFGPWPEVRRALETARPRNAAGSDPIDRECSPFASPSSRAAARSSAAGACRGSRSSGCASCATAAPRSPEGIEVHRIEGQRVRVYSVAKTLADLFKARNRVGLDVAMEALREAWRERRFTMSELDRAARACRVAQVIRPYVEGVVA